MQTSKFRIVVIVAIAAFASIFSSQANAQLVSAGMSGHVRDADGKAVANAAVTVVFTPTNAKFEAVSNELGRFNFRGLPVGGPFTVTAKSGELGSQEITGVETVLGIDIEVVVVLRSDVVVLEAFVATASRTDLDGNATGSGLTLDGERLSGKPTSERSLADMISASPMVTLRDTFGDREESQITAVGQNNRFNSIQIDGSRINDLFGLNGTGMASFFNPLSLDTLEQLTVQVSPYDVRQAGFTGASINAVTKSGTNKFKGSAYTYFRGDSLLGQRLQGYNARENNNTGAKEYPLLERSTYGATLGGPIWKDHVFFFVSYEKFKSTIAGRDARFSTPSEAQILQKLDSITQAAGDTIDWGSPVTGSTANVSKDKKINAKVDWQINADHKLSVRYTTTEGEVPQFGNYASSSSSLNGVRGGIVTSPVGHFYAQTRNEKTVAAQLDSQWTSALSSEIRYSQTKQEQQTPVNSVAPMLLIVGLTGTDLVDNSTVTDGSYIAGTEQFRHGNVINVDSKQMSATVDYVWRDFVFTAGYQREQTDFYNLFRNGSYGTVAFRSLADFLADNNAVIQRNVYDPSVRDVADVSSMATNGIFAQARWDYSRRLTLTGGLRLEFVESATPPFNQAFFNDTGFRNDGNLDGTKSLSPRLGFNLALDDERKSQVRGGFGHFFGRAPWVIFSNSWNSPGVGSFTLLSAQNQLPKTLTGYLQTEFDPQNPIGTGVDNPSLRREVDWSEDGTELPQSWRGNLAFDRKVEFFDSTFSAEVVHSIVDKAIFVTNENIKPTSIGADGRQRFAGNTSSLANVKYAGYTEMIRVQNSSAGESTYLTLRWNRPMKKKWGFDLAYTRGRSTEAQSIGQTTAGGQWFRNATFNQNTVEESTSDFEIKDRVQLSLSRQFEFVKNCRTTASIYYEGRSGNPYSWVFASDLNGDGRTFNDRVAVPSGIDDSRFDFSGMPAADRDALLAFVRSSELAKYAGGVAPRNAFTEPWVNRLDLKFVQDIPLRGDVKLQLFFDFINLGSFLSKSTFGYYELAPNLSNGVFRTKTLTTSTSYGTDGRIKPSYTRAPTDFAIDNGMSRWRIQLGAKLLF